MMELDPKAKALLTAIAAAGDPGIDSLPIALARELVERGYSRMKIPVKQVGAVENRLVVSPDGETPVRIYTPIGEGPFPVMVFFHGGGWVFFSLDSYNPICTHLCAGSGSVVVSVDYRLSPEFKFPAAVNDCYTVAKWVGEHCSELHGDPENIILVGDSAGGNLATVTAMRLRDEGGPVPKSQILIYPVTDYLLPEKTSFIEFANGFGLTMADMRWFWEKYLEKEQDAMNPLVAPLKAPDLSGLPPALILVSGYDPLRDEGIMFAERLKDAGVPVQLSVYENMIHGFISYLGILDQAKNALGEISGWTKKMCNTTV